MCNAAHQATGPARFLEENFENTRQERTQTDILSKSAEFVISLHAMSDYENVSPEEASKLVSDKSCFVIDVRTPAEFNAHRIAGAYLLPIQELNARYTEIP